MAVTCEIHWSIFHHVNCYLRWNNTSVLLGEFYDQYRRYSTAKNDFKFSHDLISEQNTRLLCASHIKWSRTQNDNEKISVSGCPKRDTRQKNLSAYRNRNTYNTRRVSRAHTRHTTHRLKCIRSLLIYDYIRNRPCCRPLCVLWAMIQTKIYVPKNCQRTNVIFFFHFHHLFVCSFGNQEWKKKMRKKKQYEPTTTMQW